MDAVVAPKDRSAGLVVFGLLQVLLGFVCIGFTLLVAAATEFATNAPATAPSGADLAGAMVVYALAAVYFLSAGVGSIRGRRWARALSVVVSALWMAGGAVATVMVAILLPKMREALPAAGSPAMMSGCAIGGMLVAGVLLPLGLFLFYRSPHVLATCERRDPKPRWTDRVPLPVLAVVIVLAFASVALLASLAKPVLPLAGTVLTGAPAVLTLLSLSFLSAFLAVQLYRLKESAWWTLVLLQVIGCVIGVLTLTRLDESTAGTVPVAEIYRDPVFIAVLIATWVAYFAFLLYLRRYFGRIVPRTRSGDYSTFSR
ncbi:MAG TPA: hypothetical protein VMS98_05920 [Thermoanaerobaculia bacterium]|nr:hypothetical protein [Thermoanaerobaculia bacterium]